MRHKGEMSWPITKLICFEEQTCLYICSLINAEMVKGVETDPGGRPAINSLNDIWVRSRNCGCLVTWFCYQLIAKPGNKTATVPWPDPYTLKWKRQDDCLVFTGHAEGKLQLPQWRPGQSPWWFFFRFCVGHGLLPKGHKVNISNKADLMPVKSWWKQQNGISINITWIL